MVLNLGLYNWKKMHVLSEMEYQFLKFGFFNLKYMGQRVLRP